MVTVISTGRVNDSIRSVLSNKPKILKSRKRRPEVDRLDGQWARWSIGLMVYRLNGQ